MLRSIRRALRPGGRLLVVEFDKEKAGTDFVKKHVRATRGEFVAEIRAAGFEPVELASAPGLKENFLAAFRKVPGREGKGAEKAGSTPAGARP
jgi:hypothetical protein